MMCKCKKHWVLSLECGICLTCLLEERDRYKAALEKILEPESENEEYGIAKKALEQPEIKDKTE